MITRRAALWSKLALLAVGALASAGLMISPSYAANDTEVYIVQGLPSHTISFAVDGDSVVSGLAGGKVA